MSESAELRLSELKREYLTVFTAMDRHQITLSEVNLRDNKLRIKAEAPSQAVRQRVLDALEAVNPNWHDEVQADIRVPDEDANLPDSGQTVVNTSQDFSKQGALHTRRSE